MTYACTVCGEQTPAAPLRVMLDPRYRFGYCLTCKRTQTFRETSPEALRDAGMAKVAQSAGQGVDAAWQAAAGLVARRLAASGQPFTVEDLEKECGLPSHRNAVGALVNSLARAGVIEWTGEMRHASRDSRHSNLNRVWRGRAAA